MEARLTPDGLLSVIGCGAALVLAWPVIVALYGPQPVVTAPLIAHVAGMLAGYGVLILLAAAAELLARVRALMSRAPALERGVGADILARWHGYGGRTVIGLVVVHAWAALVAWAQSRQESLALSLGHVLRLPWLIATTVGTVALLVAAGASIRGIPVRCRDPVAGPGAVMRCSFAAPPVTPPEPIDSW